MDWESLDSVKKGNVGEQIVKSSLEKRGFVVYKCITKKAHAFDFLAVKNKKIFIVAEIKSKARLNNFRATGIDVRHCNEYLTVMKEMKTDIILFFVDEHPKEERVYCQKLTKLMEKKVISGIEYPNTKIAKNIILFSLEDMVEVKKLDPEELRILKLYSHRNYQYN